MRDPDLVLQALQKAAIDFDRNNWDPAKSFAENGLDSLDFNSLLMSIGKLYGIKITDVEASELFTPNDLAALIRNRL